MLLDAIGEVVLGCLEGLPMGVKPNIVKTSPKSLTNTLVRKTPRFVFPVSLPRNAISEPLVNGQVAGEQLL